MPHDEASRLAVLERRAEESQIDRDRIWHALSALESIKVHLATISEKLDTGKKTFEDLEADLRETNRRLADLELRIPVNLVGRLGDLERGEEGSKAKVAILWTSLMGAGAAVLHFVEKLILAK